VDITPDLEHQQHTFRFDIDLSHLPSLMMQLRAALASWPVRGLAPGRIRGFRSERTNRECSYSGHARGGDAPVNTSMLESVKVRAAHINEKLKKGLHQEALEEAYNLKQFIHAQHSDDGALREELQSVDLAIASRPR